MTATPPTTPPAIAPALELGEGGGVGVGVGVGVVGVVVGVVEVEVEVVVAERKYVSPLLRVREEVSSSQWGGCAGREEVSRELEVATARGLFR
jgi:hypothetical protein